MTAFFRPPRPFTVETVLVQTAKGRHIWHEHPLWRARTRMLNIEDLFKGRHFDREIIIRDARL